MSARLSSIRDLRALAWTVGPTRDFRVVQGGSRASWSPTGDVLTVPADVFEELSRPARAGLVCHECGHGWVSRYHLFLPTTGVARAAVEAQALNALEEARCESFMVRRYPAVRSWLDALYLETKERPPETDDPRLRFLFWCSRARLDDWQIPDRGDEADPAVVAALRSTRRARVRHARTLPSPDGARRPEEGARKTCREVLGRRFADAGTEDPWEATVRLSAWRAHRIAVQQILPVLEQLRPPASDDPDDLTDEASPERDPDPSSIGMSDLLHLVLSGKISSDDFETLLSASGSRVEVGGEGLTLGLVSKALDALRGDDKGSRVPPHLVRKLLGLARTRSRSRSSRPPTDLPSMKARVAPHVGACVAQLRRVLARRRRDFGARPFPEGTELDPEAVMRTSVDPSAWDAAFRRPAPRDRLDATVFLLVDLSGSMAGGECQAAQEGVLLFARSLDALEVPHAIYGFQDVLIPFAPFERAGPLDMDKMLERMRGEIEGTAPDGHNRPRWNDDGPCLMEAAEVLSQRTERDRLLIVISDGRPAGCRSNEDDLHRAVRLLQRAESGLRLVGLGLGPNTTHVADFFGAAALPGIALADLPAKLGGVLSGFLQRSAT